ncbi:unnamed protein product [Rhizoctonia solani]|uniref:Uncharacterized protein n=1 Tax=Rhizoctonia solani TaxID=456999 RepID=A0A8H3HF32_9AGAM|nr:unnamed protein product [Rhizoctonia solani]
MASTARYDSNLNTSYSSLADGHNPIGHLPALLVSHPPIPSTSQHIAALAGYVPTPSMGGSADTRPFPPAGRSIAVPSQANLSGSLCNLTRSEPIAPLTSARLDHSQSRATHAPEWPASYLDDEPETEDSENIEAGLLNGLALDRQAESNTLPFIVHCFAAWMTRFTFEPTRILPIIINHIRHGYAVGEETRQAMLLVSGSGLAVSRSTDYDLSDFNALQKQLMDRLIETRARSDTEFTNELALATMEHSHQVSKLLPSRREFHFTDEKFISTLFKVGSLASVLHVMGLYAPVFRRACPEPSNGFVNLPRRLTAMEIQLKYYSTLDVLQSVITNRPMFFRYDLDYLSPQEEALIKSDYGPGLRWLYGVPDRLMITLARMNTLFEDHGNRLDPERVQEIEKEIADCALVVNTSHGINPTLNIGRATVQQSWKMAATIYLYMGLCGADSKDVRVAKVRKKFIKLLRGIKPSRNPDSFLILPILIVSFTSRTFLLPFFVPGRGRYYIFRRPINPALTATGYIRMHPPGNSRERYSSDLECYLG